MLPAQRIALRLSEVRSRLNEIAGMDNEGFTDEIRQESDALAGEYQSLEARSRAALIAQDDEEMRTTEPDAEMRERLELRSRAHLGNYLEAALRGRAVGGAEAELAAAARTPDGVPFELWAPTRRSELEARAITAAPSPVGLNLNPLQPFVFAPSALESLMVDMPEIPSGTFASGTITTAATAGAVPKGGTGTTGEVPETEALFEVTTSTPHRIGASLNLALEDLAAVGQENFESLLREHISVAVSAELDDQMLNGDGSGANITGFFQRLADPTAAPSAIADFNEFASIFAGGIDGLWATELAEVAILAGPATMQLSAQTFQTAASYAGEMSAAAYARNNTGGWKTNSRMPDAATFMTVDDIQQAILCRKGRSMMPTPMRTAVVGSYGYFTIDDIYTGALKGQRRFVINTLITDLIIVQSGAYEQVAFKTA